MSTVALGVAPGWRLVPDRWPRRYTVVGLFFLSTVICFVDRVNVSVAIIPMARLGLFARDPGSGRVGILLGLPGLPVGRRMDGGSLWRQGGAWVWRRLLVVGDPDHAVGRGGIAGTVAFMEELGFRPGRLQAALAGLVETGGGLLLAACLFSSLAAAMIIAVMLVATVTVPLAKGFFMQNGGCEYNLALAAGALALTFTGPGALSLDAPWGSPGLAPGGV